MQGLKSLLRSGAPFRVAKRRRGSETVSRKRLRGRQSIETSRVQKTARTQTKIVGDGRCAVPQILPRVFRDFMGKIKLPVL